MASPNGLNPKFIGQAKAGSFEATHGKGISSTCITLSGTTASNLFGTTNGFRGVITGLLFSALTGTASTITVKSGLTGATVASITAGNANGNVSGPSSGLANTTISLTGTMTATSNSALEAGTLTIFYKTNED
jgi:hypothetical protein